uniref:Peptidase A2 domain-containing protein n=1 Tax=Rhodnius prolixus TaxID=13249 RepID=T1I925_RHOPR
MHEFNKSKCPAFGKQCRKCLKYNHFAIVCHAKLDKVREVEDVGNDSDLLKISTSEMRKMTISLNINGLSLQALIDTGATCNVIGWNHINAMEPCPMVRNTRQRLKFFNGAREQAAGECTLPIKIKRKLFQVKFFVTNHEELILGLGTALEMELINPDKEVLIRKTEVEKYKDVFSKELGDIGTLKLQLKSDAVPVIESPRRFPIGVRRQIKEELENLERQGIIRKVNKPTEWTTNMVLVVTQGETGYALLQKH